MPPPPLAAAGSAALFFLGLLFFGGFALFALLAALRKNRAAIMGAAQLRAGPLRGSAAYPVAVTLGDDGFWLLGDTVPKGALILYAYLSGAQRHSGRVRYRPGAQGQFVYTGGKPESAEVLGVTVDEPGTQDPDFFPADSISFDAPAVAWYATQAEPASSPPPERQDPPAY